MKSIDLKSVEDFEVSDPSLVMHGGRFHMTVNSYDWTSESRP